MTDDVLGNEQDLLRSLNMDTIPVVVTAPVVAFAPEVRSPPFSSPCLALSTDHPIVSSSASVDPVVPVVVAAPSPAPADKSLPAPVSSFVQDPERHEERNRLRHEGTFFWASATMIYFHASSPCLARKRTSVHSLDDSEKDGDQ